MPGWFDHLLALALAVFFPIRAATFGYRRLMQAAEADVPRVRTALYGQAMTIQWTLAALVLGRWLLSGRSGEALGLGLRTTPVALVVTGVAVVLGVFLLVQAGRATRSPAALEKVMQPFAHMRRMLPHTREDLRRFLALSLTAGICEELLYRGFLIWYFGQWFPPLVAVLLAALLFGIGHAYQGARGVLLTGIVGVVLGGIYSAAGALWPAMWLHATGDIQAGVVAQAALSRASAGAAETMVSTEPAPGT